MPVAITLVFKCFMLRIVAAPGRPFAPSSSLVIDIWVVVVFAEAIWLQVACLLVSASFYSTVGGFTYKENTRSGPWLLLIYLGEKAGWSALTSMSTVVALLLLPLPY